MLATRNGMTWLRCRMAKARPSNEASLRRLHRYTGRRSGHQGNLILVAAALAAGHDPVHIKATTCVTLALARGAPPPDGFFGRCFGGVRQFNGARGGVASRRVGGRGDWFRATGRNALG